jgi:hypothetical protein
MITKLDKQLIINSKILEIDEIYQSNLNYIELINNGMEDPDYGIEQCEQISIDLIAQKQILLNTLNDL